MPGPKNAYPFRAHHRRKPTAKAVGRPIEEAYTSGSRWRCAAMAALPRPGCRSLTPFAVTLIEAGGLRRRDLALNRGNTERQKSGTRGSLRAVHFQTPYTGWAVGRTETANGGGSIGVMLRTTDGGLKWEEMGTNVLPGLHAVRFFDEKAGFVCGDGSPAFPSGMFTTGDGGRTWKPVPSAKLVSCRGADFLRGSRTGVVAGAWSRLGTISHDGFYKEADFDPLAGRSLHAVTWGCTVNEKALQPAFAVGDGGAVLKSTDGGKSWGFVNLGLTPQVLASCDFRCCASFGSHVWVAGKPGGFVLHSADQGQTWEVQKTEVPLPVNGLYFLTHEIGWIVGELGCIHGTIDGGKTWRVQQTGGQRAAVLCLHALIVQRPRCRSRCSATERVIAAPRSA